MACTATAPIVLDRAQKFSWLVAVVCLVSLGGCGGGGGEEPESPPTASATPAPTATSEESDSVNGASEVEDEQRPTRAYFAASGQAPVLALNTRFRILASRAGSLATEVPTSAAVTGDLASAWTSQKVENCSSNPYCGHATVIMAAKLLNAPNLAASRTTSYGGFLDILTPNLEALDKSVAKDSDSQKAIMSWKNSSLDKQAACSASFLGSSTLHIEHFAKNLGLVAETASDSLFILDGRVSSDLIHSWILKTLSEGSPIAARVHYQGRQCRGQVFGYPGTKVPSDYSEYYNNGTEKTVEMIKCGADLNDERARLAGRTELGHWVLIVKADSSGISVLDSDNNNSISGTSTGGLRKYSKDSFIRVLRDSAASNENPAFVSFGSDNEKLPAFSYPQAIEVQAGVPIGGSVSPFAVSSSSASFSAIGLPLGLNIDSKGRLVGTTIASGTHTVTVVMKEVRDGIERVAKGLLNVLVREKLERADQPSFVSNDRVPTAQVGRHMAILLPPRMLIRSFWIRVAYPV